MSDTAIRVQNLGKRYRIGERVEPGGLLVDQIVRSVKRPFQQAAKRLNRTNANGESDPAQIWALRDVSFEIAHGEAIGIIGRNGAGKSTLLKILARITKPTTGRADLYGRVGSLLEVGTGFHPELTGRENIFLNGAMLGMHRAEIKRKFDEIVAFAEVEQFIDTPVKHYSSGMAVRLAFAVAAHLEPEILLVDEVLAVGDTAFQKKCLGKMGDVTRQGRTVLFVSHDLTSIQVLCQRAIRMAHGQVQGIGKVQDQITEYLVESKQLAQNELDHPIELSPEIQLRKFGFEPHPVTSGSAGVFTIELISTQPLRADEIGIYILDSLNRNVAFLDLRQPDMVYRANANEPLAFRVAVDTLPLVEGSYRIGFWLRGSGVRLLKNDLFTMEVISRASAGGIVPYRAMYRGVLELDYSIRTGNGNSNGHGGTESAQ